MKIYLTSSGRLIIYLKLLYHISAYLHQYQHFSLNSTTSYHKTKNIIRRRRRKRKEDGDEETEKNTGKIV